MKVDDHATFSVRETARNYDMIRIDEYYLQLFNDFRKTFIDRFKVKHNELMQKNWTSNSYQSNVKIFMQKDLKIPKALLGQPNILKMALVLKPAVVQQQMKEEEYNPYKFISKVFSRATEDLRVLFMKDDLMKHLWSRIFISESPQILIQRLRSIRGELSLGEAKFHRFYSDMECQQYNFGFQILPHEAKEREAIKPFTDYER